MKLKDKQELLDKLVDKLFDEDITYPAHSINNPFNDGFDDKTEHFSINDETKLVFHKKSSIGVTPELICISGSWHGVPLENILFKNFYEAIDICIILHLLEQESKKLKVLSDRKVNFLSKFKKYNQMLVEQASIICLNKKFNEFLSTRYSVSRTKPENIADNLKDFNPSDYVTDKQYETLINNIIKEKENDLKHKQTANYYIKLYYNENKKGSSAVLPEPASKEPGYAYAIGSEDYNYEEYIEEEEIDQTTYCKNKINHRNSNLNKFKKTNLNNINNYKYKNHDLEK